MATGSTHREDYAWRTTLSPRNRFAPSEAAEKPALAPAPAMAGGKRQRPLSRPATSPNAIDLAQEAEIGLAGLYQARSGGNRAMIANAERFLVTNVALTSRQRSDLVAPWLRDDTRSFLSDRWPSTREIPTMTSPPAWRQAANRKREDARLQLEAERDLDRHLEELVAKQSASRELHRARDILSRRDTLNDELLEVASEASGGSFPAKISHLDASRSRPDHAQSWAPEVFETKDVSDDARERTLALQEIADRLTLHD